jgi:hypothetical protein
LFVSTWGPGLSGGLIQNGEWNHVAASNVGTNFRLYLNGVNVASGNVAVATPASSTFLIGRQGPGPIGDVRRLDGMVDEVTVFNRALSDSEILDMYQAGRDGMVKPYMVVNNSVPGEADSVTTRPTEFTIDFSHPIDPASIQASDFIVNGIAATSYSMIDADTVRFHYSSSPVGVLGVQRMSMAASSVLASDGPPEPSLRAWSKSFTYVGTVQVGSTMVNDGEIQRSRVTSLTVTFNTGVAFAGTIADALTLTRNNDGAAVSFTGTASTIGGVTKVTLNGFNGSATQFGSLADGRFTLTALASQISANGQALDGNGDGTPGDNFTFGDAQGLFRFFGDINGDRHVDIADFGLFSSSFNLSTGQTGFIAAFDFNGDGVIDIADFGQFSVRLFTPLP